MKKKPAPQDHPLEARNRPSQTKADNLKVDKLGSTPLWHLGSTSLQKDYAEAKIAAGLGAALAEEEPQLPEPQPAEPQTEEPQPPLRLWRFLPTKMAAKMLRVPLANAKC